MADGITTKCAEKEKTEKSNVDRILGLTPPEQEKEKQKETQR